MSLLLCFTVESTSIHARNIQFTTDLARRQHARFTCSPLTPGHSRPHFPSPLIFLSLFVVPTSKVERLEKRKQKDRLDQIEEASTGLIDKAGEQNKSFRAACTQFVAPLSDLINPSFSLLTFIFRSFVVPD